MMSLGVIVGLHLAGAGAVLWIGLAVLVATYEHRPVWPVVVDARPACPIPFKDLIARIEAGERIFPRDCDPDNPPPFMRGATTSGYRAGGGPIWTPRVQEW